MEQKTAGKREKQNKISARRAVCALTGALFLSVTFFWGRQLDAAGSVKYLSVRLWLETAAVTALLTPVLAWAFRALSRRLQRGPAERTTHPDPMSGQVSKAAPGLFFLRVAFLFLAWLPVFLAVYPGFFAYDATEELEEVLSGAYVTRQPLLHVLLLGKTVLWGKRHIGSYNGGIAVYVLAQMLFMALLLSWVLGEIRRSGVKRPLRAAALLFFAFFPVIPMFVLCTAKDMPYTAAMLAVMVFLWKMGGKNSWKTWAGLFFALFAMAMFRNNGFYVFLAMLPVILGMAGRAGRKSAAAVCLAALLACVGTRALLNAALDPVSTDAQETLTVPIQQAARAWNYSPELFGGAQKEVLFEVLPQEVLERYTPKLSDLVKIDFRAERFREDPARYAKLWLDIGKRAPLTYLNAWLMTSYGFWYPFTVIDVYNGSRSYYTESSYFSCETEPPGVRQSRFPLLECVYQAISWRELIHRIPVVSWPFSPGFLCWIYVLAGLYLLSEGKWRGIGILAPVCLNLLTVLLGPTYLVRYVLIFWFALPLLPVVIKSQMCYTAMDNGEIG